MSEAREDASFSDLSSACSSQIWSWEAVNKQKQANSSNEESENLEVLPSKILFIWPFLKILCVSSESSKSGSIFWLHLLPKQFWVAQLQTQCHQISHQRLSCKSAVLVAPGRQTALAHPMILENGPKTKSCDSGLVVLSKHSSAQTPKHPRTIVAQN